MVQLVNAPIEHLVLQIQEIADIVRTRVRATNQNPWSALRAHLITIRHWQVHILGEIDQIIDCLLNSVQPEALNGQVWVWIAEAVEPVLDDDSRTILLLGDTSIDGSVCEITVVAIGVAFPRRHQNDGAA